MSRSFKISFDDGLGQKELFVVKPSSDDFRSLLEELYLRKPEFRNKSVQCSYEDSDGDKIAIKQPSDYVLFLEQNINKIFAVASEESVNPSPFPVASNPTNPESKSSSIDEIRSIFHEGFLCDVCDKQIYGFRYKCLDCEEFDMCMDCAPKQIHKEHLLLRITNPIDGANNFHLEVLPNE